MKSWMALLVATLLVMTIIGAGGLPVAAQDALRCDVEHRSPAAIVESAAGGDESLPIPDATPYAVPNGTPADGETTERVRALAETIVACVNEGDLLGFMSLLSNDFLRRHFGEFDLSFEALTQLAATPVPMPDSERLAIVELRDVILLPDGRISVLVRLDQGEITSQELNSVLTLVEVDGHLLIDEWQPVLFNKGTDGDWQLVHGEGYEGVIVPAEDVETFIHSLTGREPRGTWTPTPETIATLESKLPDFLRNAPAAASDLYERVADYQRQYAGYVTEDGRELILVNAFCTAYDADWTMEPIFILDGGDCFFTVSYDPSTGSFEDLMINGKA